MIALPLRPRHRQEPGIAAAGRLAHRGTPYGTSLSFATTTHLWPLPDPPSRKLPQRNQPHWDRPVNSGPRPCLVSVGFPLSGSRDRTSTSDLNIRTWHTRGASPSGSACDDRVRACPLSSRRPVSPLPRTPCCNHRANPGKVERTPSSSAGRGGRPGASLHSNGIVWLGSLTSAFVGKAVARRWRWPTIPWMPMSARAIR